MKKRIAIFASGEGTNAQRIIDYFQNSSAAEVSMIVTNKAEANVVNRAKSAEIPVYVVTRSSFYESDETIQALKKADIDLLVLAGFLWMIPDNLIKAFPNKIVNIHPALLPKFGGKGMYGMNVHKAVIDAKEKESGVSVHYVNEHYDEGEIISQHKCIIDENDTPELLAQKIHKLEHEFFPLVIEKLLSVK
ncbi:MAG: phosphoribosylglycinamide formyltransferase [Bacteroidota bacterium]|jgi:phosphoribosylglycinamide formyltransferase-1|nr:phosphoribosylglycinamide formyltransferase [Bacteroidota bacterium]